jgi:energy-coupling factor transporter ATP-binding protein EcfA2
MKKILQVENILAPDSWPARWLKCWPTAEPPKSFILFSGLCAVGAAIGRKCWMDLEPHTLYPMLNVLLIGPSGTGKSTSANMGLKLLRSWEPNFQVIAGASTKPKLHFDLAADSHALIFASELASSITKSKTQEDLVPYLTELLDYYPDRPEYRTKGGDISRVVNSQVTILGCSTVEWLQDQLPGASIAGGFLPRFLLVYEEHKSQRIALPGMHLSESQRQRVADLQAQVFDEYRHIVEAASGEITFKDWHTCDFFSDWYASLKPETQHLAPFAERAREFVLRIAMLLAICDHRTQVEQQDLEIAMDLQSWAMRRLQHVAVPRSPNGKILQQCLEAIPIGESVSDIHIKRVMSSHATADETQKLISSLIQTRDIERTPDGKYRRIGSRSV